MTPPGLLCSSPAETRGRLPSGPLRIERADTCERVFGNQSESFSVANALLAGSGPTPLMDVPCAAALPTRNELVKLIVKKRAEQSDHCEVWSRASPQSVLADPDLPPPIANLGQASRWRHPFSVALRTQAWLRLGQPSLCGFRSQRLPDEGRAFWTIARALRCQEGRREGAEEQRSRLFACKPSWGEREYAAR